MLLLLVAGLRMGGGAPPVVVSPTVFLTGPAQRNTSGVGSVQSNTALTGNTQRNVSPTGNAGVNS